MICHIFVCKTPTKCGQGLMNKSCQISDIMTQKQSAPKTYQKFCVKTTKFEDQNCQNISFQNT